MKYDNTTTVTHLDVAQGDKEERVSRMLHTVNERLTRVDTAIRQKQARKVGLCSNLRACDG